MFQQLSYVIMVLLVEGLFVAFNIKLLLLFLTGLLYCVVFFCRFVCNALAMPFFFLIDSSSAFTFSIMSAFLLAFCCCLFHLYATLSFKVVFLTNCVQIIR